MQRIQSVLADGLVSVWDSGPFSSLLSNDRDAVLMYHSVDSRPLFEDLYGNIPPWRLERDLRYVSSEYRVTDLRSIATDRTLGEKRIALTFDDGFQNFYTNVLPLLRDYELPATVFVAPGIVGDPELSESALGGVTRLSVADEKVLMDDRQLEDLATEPLVTIGNHTRTHRPLDELDPDEQRREITGGKTDLEDSLGISVREFSYPYGAFDSTSATIVEEGHDLAVTAKHELVEKHTDAFHVPRLTAHVGEMRLRKDLVR